MAITTFRGKNWFLSNFYLCSGKLAPSVEHHFQAAKTADLEQKRNILSASTAGLAKSLGRRVELRDDWDDVKDAVMLSLIRRKFTSSPALKASLLATGDEDLIEGNSWGDRYWGKTRNLNGVFTGENRLGEILMQVRKELRHK